MLTTLFCIVFDMVHHCTDMYLAWSLHGIAYWHVNYYLTQYTVHSHVHAHVALFYGRELTLSIDS